MENIINTNEKHRFRLFDAKYHVNVGKFDVYLLSLKKVFFSQKGGSVGSNHESWTTRKWQLQIVEKN